MQEQIAGSAQWAFVLMGIVFLYHTFRSERQAEISTEEEQDENMARWTLAAILDLKIGVYWIGAVIAFGFAAILWMLT